MGRGVGSGSCPYPRGKIVAFDVETNGLKAHKGHRIFAWAYITELGEYGYMRKTPENVEWVKRLFLDKSKTVVVHNGKFELKMLQAEGLDVFEHYDHGALVEDTMLMSKVLNSTEQEHGLKFCGRRYVGRDTTDKSDIEDWLKEHNRKKFVRNRGGRVFNFSDVPDDVLKRRVLWDVETTLYLYFFFRSRIRAMCEELYQTERNLLYVCFDMETHGVEVDVTRAKELKAQALLDLEKMRRDLNDLVLPLTIPKKRKRRVNGEKVSVIVDEVLEDEFNPGSQPQMVAAFRKLGIELKYKTQPKKDKKTGMLKGGGNWAFDEYAMIRYVSRPLVAIIRDSGEEGWPAARFYSSVHATIREHSLPKREMLMPLVLKYRELSKMVTTYYDHIIDDAVDVVTEENGRERGRMHCLFNQSEAMTGRFSSSDPNLQNMPRILGPRECFLARRGRHNWHLDYSQVEMRMFVHFAKDEHMAAEIDKDIHLYVATRIYNKPRDQVTKEQRKRAKGTGFGILYGSGPGTQAETLTKKGLPTTKPEASRIVANFHREFPSVRRLTNQLKIELARNGYIENPFGRRYYIPTKFGYKALNYLCQGTPADLIKRAMVKIWKWLRAEGHWPRVRLIMTIHDELVIECPPSLAGTIIPQILRMMEDRTTYFVPVTCEAEVSPKRWSQKLDPAELGFQIAA